MPFIIFDSNIILTTKQLALWQSKIQNVQIIPNFLAQIPNQNTNLSQKVVLSIGRMSKNDEKRFIWQKIIEAGKDLLPNEVIQLLNDYRQKHQ